MMANSTKPTASTRVSVMRGSRGTASADGRQRRITLTDEGIALLGAGTESARLTNAHYSSTLPEGMAEDVRRHFRRILLAEQAGTAGQPLIGP